MGAEESSMRGNRLEGCMTVILRHGGRFVENPTRMYVGGNNKYLEGVNMKKGLSMNLLRNCTKDLGLLGKLSFYAVLNGSFKLLSTDEEVVTWAKECWKNKCRVVEVCVDVVSESSGGSHVRGEPTVGGEPAVGEEVRNIESDGSDYNVESDESDDDLLWESNVDKEVDEDETTDESGGSEEDIVWADDDFDETRASDEESTPGHFSKFNKDVIYDPEFEISMLFENRELFKKAITSHAINSKRCLYLKKNDKIRVHARCRGEGCDWACNALKVKDEETFQIRTYQPTHKCPPTFHVTNLSSTWLGQKHLSDFQSDPKRNIKGWRQDVMRNLNVHMSTQQAYRARVAALKTIEGVPDLQYEKLWDYAEELKNSNPGSTVVLDLDSEGKFSKMYVCFEACKRGFHNGCRPFIGVDGCWLKGPRGGILLSAVGVDPGNAIFPLAFAVVSVENRETWDWFLLMLKYDFHIQNGENYTFMSDKQKGLILAMREVFPNADHRHCVRHMHNNFVTAGFRGLAYKDALWRAARASTVGVFNDKMRAMRALNEAAVEWFADKHPKQWSLSHFSEKSKCDLLLNNLCESFNSAILDARDKPIITMLEWIRQWLMERFQKKKDKAATWECRFPPAVTKILRENMKKMNDFIPMKSNNRHYQIQCSSGSMFAVDLELHTCSCRMWELSGIPCKHAMAAISNQHCDPELFVDDLYSVATYKKVYEPALIPIAGQIDWASTLFIPPMPPNFGKVRRKGRPATVRRGEVGENLDKRRFKMKRQLGRRKCRRCGVPGHTIKQCGVPTPVHPEPAPAHEVPTTVHPEPPVHPEPTPVHPEPQVTPNPAESLFTEGPPVTPTAAASIFDEVLAPVQPTNNEESAPVVKKLKVKRKVNVSLENKDAGANAPKKVKVAMEKRRGPPRPRVKSVTGSNTTRSNVTTRNLIDEDDTEFEALLSQANSGMPPVYSQVGPSPWEQLQKGSKSFVSDKGSQSTK